MDNCYLDRFDAHQGLHNAKITNSTLGFGILVIGGGELYIENVYRVSEGAFVLLRTDYNSVFDGDLIIKNCRMGAGITSLISGTWRSFYNGLPNYMFRSVSVDGLTVVALGTSLPELFTSVTAALKKNADIAIGNIVGSNIFNILFILGAAAVIVPVPFQPLFRVDTVVAFVAGIVLLAFSLGKKRQLGRVGGAVMLLSYAAYFAYLVTL
jgi:Ca2+/Na+ antiporter